MPEPAGARVTRDDEYQQPQERHLRAVPDERRTVKITGQPVRARPRRSSAAGQIQARPDRIVLWAFLLGLFLVFMAVATANAATL
jgi:thiol:disulfide interchange protein